MIPAITTTVSASWSVDACSVMTTAMATAIGPVGPEICERVPPNTRCEEAQGDRAVQPGHRAEARSYPEGQSDRQAHHGRGDAAEDVASQRMKVVSLSSHQPPPAGH